MGVLNTDCDADHEQSFQPEEDDPQLDLPASGPGPIRQESSNAISSLTEQNVSESFPRESRLCLHGLITQRSEYAEIYGSYADIWSGELYGNKIAIKIMEPRRELREEFVRKKSLKRAWREYLAWSSLIHPNILPYLGYSYDFSDHILEYQVLEYQVHLPALISPWMPNGNMRSYITSWPAVDRLPLISGIADGLAFLHDRSPPIVHGYISGENVLVSDQGIPRLTGFCIASILLVGHDSSELLPHEAMRWISPEHLQTGKTDQHSDVWAFGMTILEITTGKAPYSECSRDIEYLLELWHRRTPRRPDELTAPSLTDELWLICQRCWDPDPEKRPAMRDIRKMYPLHPRAT